MPVVHYRPRYLALSTEHPMQCGWDPQPFLKEADVVLVVDCDVPWIPREGNPKPEARIIHIGPDPLFARYPLRGFRTDLALTGGVARHAAGAVAQRAEACGFAAEDRGAAQDRIKAISRHQRKKARAGVRSHAGRPSPASGSRPA